MGKIADISKDVVIKFRGDLYIVSDFQHVNPGKGSSFVRTRLKSLGTGKVIDFNFKDGDSVDVVSVQRRKMQFLYSSGGDYTFMDNETFEQTQVPSSQVGDSAKFLKEGMEVWVVMHENAPRAVTMPKKVTLKVVRAPEAVKGDTSSGNVTKDVELETGATVRAPLFIKSGDEIVINTETGQYAERAKG